MSEYAENSPIAGVLVKELGATNNILQKYCMDEQDVNDVLSSIMMIGYMWCLADANLAVIEDIIVKNMDPAKFMEQFINAADERDDLLMELYPWSDLVDMHDLQVKGDYDA